jgi:hypothetical protein
MSVGTYFLEDPRANNWLIPRGSTNADRSLAWER